MKKDKRYITESVEAVGMIKAGINDNLPKGKVQLLSLDMPDKEEKAGDGIYLAFGRTIPQFFSWSAQNAWYNGLQAGSATLCFKIKRPEDKIYHNLVDVKNSTFLDLRYIRKESANAMAQIWQDWLSSDDFYAGYVKEEDKKPSRIALTLLDRIAAHPVFLSYLLTQDEFKHLEAVLFQFPLKSDGATLAIYLDKAPQYIEQLYSDWAPLAEVYLPEILTRHQKELIS